ncbi:ABC transporter substrate-binding protein [Cryobacterium sp. MLB-32]|uniref:ABC transporter substrate-binding protein n=1 Tax=Cryobacterium sp. MLB-32 TaxID=1529318 RepID=UPI00068FE5D3|nr:ABC transporter substrate-binding protein [Cryobacterium sp. MLB-32]
MFSANTRPTRNIRPRIAVIVAGLASVALLSGCAPAAAPAAETSPEAAVSADSALFEMLPADIQASKVIKIGTEAMYAPYEYLDADGATIVGLDPDLVTALTQRLGVTFELTNAAFDGLLPALDANRFDMLAAGYTNTVERQAQYDFVNYYKSSQGIVVKTGNPENITEMADLCGQPVSVLKASAQESMLVALNEGDCASKKVDIVSLPDNQTAFLQVQSGRVNALLVQDAVARYNIAQQGKSSTFEVSNTELITPTLVGMMFRQDSTDLRDAIQASLQSLIDDGTYAKVLDAHNVGTGAVDSATINGEIE